MRMKPVPRGGWAGWGCTQHRLRTCRRGGHPTSAVCDFHGNRPRWRACAQEHRDRRRFGDHPVAGSGYEWIVLGIFAAVFACAAVLMAAWPCGVPRAWTGWVLSTRLSCSSGRNASRVRLLLCAGCLPYPYLVGTSLPLHFRRCGHFRLRQYTVKRTFTACCPAETLLSVL